MRKYLDIQLTLALTLVLTIIMLWPINQPLPGPDASDKLIHIIAFAGLAFPLARTGRFGLIPVFIGASLYGGIIELVQPYFWRSADILDWISDLLGVICGIGLARLHYWISIHRV